MMKVHGLPVLTALLLVIVAGTRSMPADNEKSPQLKSKAILYKRSALTSSGYVAFSPDGKRLLSLSGEIKARLWEVAGEKQIAVLQHDTARTITAAAYSPDGKFIATGDRMGAIWIWNAETGKKIRSLTAAKDIGQIIYSPDGGTLLVAARGVLYRYDVKDGECFRQRRVDPRRDPASLRPVASARPMKKPLLICGNQLHDTVWGDVCYRLTDDPFFGGAGPPTAITSDEKKMAMGYQGPILIWDLTPQNQDPRGRKCITLKPPRITIQCLAFSPNDKILAAGYEYDPQLLGVPLGRGGLLLCDVASGKLLQNQDVSMAAVHALAFSPNGGLLATADRDGSVKLWEIPAAWRKGLKKVK